MEIVVRVAGVGAGVGVVQVVCIVTVVELPGSPGSLPAVGWPQLLCRRLDGRKCVAKCLRFERSECLVPHKMKRRVRPGVVCWVEPVVMSALLVHC
jgi:hypothetical protein